MVRKLFSYFIPINVYKKNSTISKSLEVTWNNGELVLDSKSNNEEECKLPDEEDVHRLSSEEERPSFALPNDSDNEEEQRPSLALLNENFSNGDDEEDKEDVLGSPIGLPVHCSTVLAHDESVEGEEHQSATSNVRNDPEERPFSV